MGFFDKKLSFGAMKDAMTEVAAKVGDSIQGVDFAGTVASARSSVSDTAALVTEKVKSVNVAETLTSARETIIEAGERTLEATQVAYETAREAASNAYVSAAEDARNFDYTQLKKVEFYQETFQHYKDLSQEKVFE